MNERRDQERRVEQSEFEWRGVKEERLRRAIDVVGADAYRNNPIVHAVLHTILQGANVEMALGEAVKALVMRNDQMMKDLVTIACSRPIQLTVPFEESKP